MLRSSLHPLVPVVALAGAGLVIACSNDADTPAQGSAGSSVSGGSASGGNTNAGSSSAGQAPSGGTSGKTGGSGSSGKGGQTAGANGGQGQGDAGRPTEDGGGPIAHGGAPNVDYGEPEVPPATWTNITGMFAGMESECGNMSRLFSNPLVDQLVLGIARKGLWSSVDGGATFAQLGQSGDMILNRLAAVAWDPGHSDVFYVSGIYGYETPFTDGVFKTQDRGASFSGFKALSELQSHNDSISVDFSDPAQKTMLAGGHEQADTLFRSKDAGATWSNIRATLPDTLGFCTWTLVLDEKRFLVGCTASYSGKAGAIMRSDDGGESWARVSDKSVNNQPLWAYDGSIYWANEAGGLLKSTDRGFTFTSVNTDATNRISPIQLPDGSVVALANRTLTATADGGKTWKSIGSQLPFEASGLDYSPFHRAFYATQFDCNAVVPADAIERYGYDFMP